MDSKITKRQNASYEGGKSRTAKLTAEDVGALPLTSGTLTGNLYIKKASLPSLVLETLDDDCVAIVQRGSNNLILVASNDKTYKNMRRIIAYNSASGIALENALKFNTRVDGVDTYYNIYGEHNYKNIKIGQNLTMFDGVRDCAVIRCYDDGDNYNYGSEVVIGGSGNTYIGGGEAPTSLYDENGSSNSEQMYVCSDNSIYFYSNCNTIANRKGIVMSNAGTFYPVTNGGFTIGTSSYRWGQIYSTASSISTSDRNEKHDINLVDAETVENLIMGLQPVTYKYDNGTSDRLHYGLIAQDVEELLNELNIPSQNFAAFIKSQKEEFNEKTGETTPVTDENGEPVYIYGLRYEEFVAPLIKMVQMQQNKIKKLEERIEKLEKMLGGDSDGMANT